MGDGEKASLRLQFNPKVRLAFHGATITTDAGLLAFREFDDALGLTEIAEDYLQESRTGRNILPGIPQIKPTFLDIAPSGIPSNIIPHSKGGKCGLIRSNSPFSYSNHRPAKPKIPKPLVYAQVSPLGTSFATP